MAEHVSLLPPNATKWERLMSSLMDPFADLSGEADSIRDFDRNPPPAGLPFLVWQYGLGELSPYLPNLYDLISEGIQWQRVRGTPAAVSRGLSWIGYGGAIEEASPRRRRWNLFQLELDRVRDDDVPDLSRIDGIVGLSPPLRSKFFRGFKGYDVRALETSAMKTSGSIWGDHSGVRITGVSAKWSFGRRHELTATPTEANLTALGVWIPSVGASGLWVDEAGLWANSNLPWAVPGTVARKNNIAQDICEKRVYVRFRNASNAIIGHARAVPRPVATASPGQYQIGAQGYSASEGAASAVFVQCRTGFGDGAGQIAASASLVFDPTLTDAGRPGALWVAPSGMTGGTELFSRPVSIEFGLTVRENVAFLLNIAD